MVSRNGAPPVVSSKESCSKVDLHQSVLWRAWKALYWNYCKFQKKVDNPSHGHHQGTTKIHIIKNKRKRERTNSHSSFCENNGNKRGRVSILPSTLLRPDQPSNFQISTRSSTRMGMGKRGELGFNILMKKHPRPVANLDGGAPILSLAEFAEHLKDLRSWRYKYTWRLSLILRRLMEHKDNNKIFNAPVDVVKYDIPTYHKVIKHPMDLQTVRCKLLNRLYEDPSHFASDVRLVFTNAMKFNSKSHWIWKSARDLLNLFDREFGKTMSDKVDPSIVSRKFDLVTNEIYYDRESSHHSDPDQCFGHGDENSKSHCDGTTCALCLSKCMEFQIPTIRCSAPCKAKIPRHGYYYRLGSVYGKYWCVKCYNNLPDTPLKAEIEKFCHNGIYLEPWVDCKDCGERMHQICALYNPRSGSAKNEGFKCPLCVIKDPVSFKSSSSKITIPSSPTGGFPTTPRGIRALIREKAKIESLQNSSNLPQMVNPSSSSLPQCSMGRFLESRVRSRIIKRMTLEKEEFDLSSMDAAFASLSPQDQASSIAESITLRVVSCYDNTCEVKEKLRQWYLEQGHTMERNGTSLSFPHRSKTILVFQKIHGIDVILFVLYVQEYGDSCPSPNKRTVYISYLDSVGYMKPRFLRTSVYHEVLSSYLRWSSSRGFEKAFIWACPSQKGDSYIIHCHPKWQRTPSSDRLRKWYIQLYEKCEEEGIVNYFSDIYDSHFNQHPPLVNTRSSSSCMTKNKTQVRSRSRTKNRTAVSKIPYFLGDYIPTEIERLLSDDVDQGSKSSAGLADDEWLMRKLAFYIKPMRNNFMLFGLKSTPPIPGYSHSSDTVDPDSTLPGSIFDNRMRLLDLSQRNHWQFDQLRRAKHSSLMIISLLQESLLIKKKTSN